MAAVRGVLLDLSGTIVRDRAFVWRLCNSVLANHGLPTVSESEFITRFREPYWRFFEEAGLGQPAARDEPYRLYQARLPSMEPEIFADVMPALSLLHAAGIRLALVTHTPAAGVRKVFSKFPLAEFFVRVVTPEDCKEQKPSPKPLLMAMESLGLPSNGCVYVGDMVEDVQAARAAGMLSAAIWRPEGSYNHVSLLKNSGADFLIESLFDLVPLVGVSPPLDTPVYA